MAREQLSREEARDILSAYRHSGVRWQAVAAEQVKEDLRLFIELRRTTGRPFSDGNALMDLHYAIDHGLLLSHRKAAERWGWEVHRARNLYEEVGLLKKRSTQASTNPTHADTERDEIDTNTSGNDRKSQPVDTTAERVDTESTQTDTEVTHPPYRKELEESPWEELYKLYQAKGLADAMEWGPGLKAIYDALYRARNNQPPTSKWRITICEAMKPQGMYSTAMDDAGNRYSGYTEDEVLEAIRRLGVRENHSVDMFLQLLGGKVPAREGKRTGSFRRQNDSGEDRVRATLQRRGET